MRATKVVHFAAVADDDLDVDVPRCDRTNIFSKYTLTGDPTKVTCKVCQGAIQREVEAALLGVMHYRAIGPDGFWHAACGVEAVYARTTRMTNSVTCTACWQEHNDAT